MGKLISQIQNYPLSAGAVALSNKLLLEDSFALQQKSLKEYFKTLFEISKDIYFFNEMGTNSSTWNDLLRKDSIFQFSRFLTISIDGFHRFYSELPQSNHFNSDIEITQSECETLCYQRFQIIQYLFEFYKTISETIAGENQAQILSILKSDPVSKLFIQFQSLADECFNIAPPLIAPASRIGVANFNDISFAEANTDTIKSLQSWYNPGNIAGMKVLSAYSDKFDKIKAANEYAGSVFINLLNIHRTFNYWATNKLTELVNSTTTNQPHIALLIAFCKLKMLYDARYDQLIHNNTRFVFNDILQLKKQPILPDTAYVNIELAKNVNQFLVEKGARFKAGKNSVNKTLYYQADQDIVLNSSKISYLKSNVRVSKQNALFTLCATDDAANKEWQVNDAWLPFNDISECNTGIAFESKLIEPVSAKDTVIAFEFTFVNNVPDASDFADKFSVSLVLNDESEEELKVESVSTLGATLKISSKLENKLANPLKIGVNTKVRLVSPGKDDSEDDAFVVLYQYLLDHELAKITVKMNQQSFDPENIETSNGPVDGSKSFIAFGTQSQAGSSFRIMHPYIRYAKLIDISINWTEILKDNVPAYINSQDISLPKNNETSFINDFNNSSGSIRIKLKSDLTYSKQSTVKSGSTTYTVESSLPRVLQVKSIDLKADLEELVYEKEKSQPLMRTERILNSRAFIKSLRIPFTNKIKQKTELRKRHIILRLIQLRFHFNNLTSYLYPLGELPVHKSSGLTFLPDYTVLGFNTFEADLYIGLTNITPGQSISLLFEIADETAEQSQLEARVSWYYISANDLKPLDQTRVVDTTRNFLQTGIVQLTLPDDATNNNSVVYGNETYWLIARCDKNYDVVANIRNIKTNGISVTRVFDADNQEAKKSVAPSTIENIYPKTANIKSVSQNTPSQNGREEETDQHYFWRSSELLRHKQRAINQWDFEHIILEKFSNIYKVKCLNHAEYDEITAAIYAKSTHTVISLIPHFVLNPAGSTFQPAIPLSKLLDIKSYLLAKTSAFTKIQVLNSQWDEITVNIEVMLNKGVLDLLFYREKLNTDIKKFFSPWAFEQEDTPALTQKIYMATVIDYIDELPYVHHIKSMKIFKNGLEQFDEIKSSSEIHLLTSAPEHTINVFEYAG